jgi:Spy/CpxP family protein refolding chaperone
MRGWLCVILMCVAVLSAPGAQTPSSKDQPGTNWSQACGHFSQVLEHLSEILALTENQQAEIKPILEQETVRVTEICSNPVFSRVEEVNQYKRLVRASDEKIKPLLSASQLQKLQNLRKEQKQDLEEIIAKQMSLGPMPDRGYQ